MSKFLASIGRVRFNFLDMFAVTGSTVLFHNHLYWQAFVVWLLGVLASIVGRALTAVIDEEAK